MLLRLYNDDSPLLDHSKDRFHTAANPTTTTTFNTAPHRTTAEAARRDVTVKNKAVASEDVGTEVEPFAPAAEFDAGDGQDEIEDDLDGGVGLGTGEGIMEIGGGD